jgi:uncharacterized protein YndB with AHSA1/START domain
MLSPEGKEFPNVGCFLEIIPNEKLVWTNALEPGYRPANLHSENPCDAFFITATISLEPHKKGSIYTALVIHKDEEDCNKHKQMGFHEGWGKACDQLVRHMKSL